MASLRSIEVVGSDDILSSRTVIRKSAAAFAVVNASVGYRYENWTFTLWAKNLLDEEYEERVFFFDNPLRWNDATLRSSRRTAHLWRDR